MKKAANIGFLLCLGAVLFAVPGLTAAKTAGSTVSYYENRELAPLPALTAADFWSGAWFNQWETWYADHVPGRTTLLTLDAVIQIQVLQRPVVNDVIVTEEVLLPFLKYAVWDTGVHRERAAPIADGFQKLAAYVEDYGGAFLLAGIPEQSNYFWDKYPDYLDSRRWNATAANDAFFSALAARGVPYLDLGAVYEELGKPDAFYSAVDHHYTYYGAFAAYQAIMEEAARLSGLDIPVLREEDVEFRTLTNPYLGSRSRKLYDRWANDAHAVMGQLHDPIPFTRRDNGLEVADSVYAMPENGTRRNTYDFYMGGDKGETVIETNRPALPNALIFGDSFTNALETLAYASFNETRSLDLRHYTEKALRDYLAEYQPDVVICVKNDTFFYAEDGNNLVWDD